MFKSVNFNLPKDHFCVDHSKTKHFRINKTFHTEWTSFSICKPRPYYCIMLHGVESECMIFLESDMRVCECVEKIEKIERKWFM